MKKTKIFFGGLKINNSRVSFPLALMVIRKDKITIRILFMKVCELSPKQIYKFENINVGIKIVTVFSTNLIFWCLNSYNKINQIYMTGFNPKAKKYYFLEDLNFKPQKIIVFIVLVFIIFFIILKFIK